MTGKNRPFPKPTPIAVAAAIVGVLLHLAVFFAIDVGVSSLPAQYSPAATPFHYAGSLNRDISQFRDPLQIYLASDYDPAFSELQNFRSLSISRELSSFPARFLLNREMEWSAWVGSQETVMNPATLIDSPDFNPFHFYQQKDAKRSARTHPQMNVLQTNLETGSVEEFTIDLPDWFLDREPVRLQLLPARFLIDGRIPHTQKKILQVSSSGDDETDRMYLRLIRQKLPSPVAGGYYEWVFFPGRTEN